METEQEYWNRLRRAAIACLSTSLRHGSPAMMDVLCELERAVYDGMTETVAPVAPDPGLREAIAKAIWDADMGYATSIAWPPLSSFRKGKTERIADAVLSVLAERGVR